MDKEYYIQLTNNLYQLTLLFPKKEPLRYKIRELADDILNNLISNSNEAYVAKNLEIIDSFFEIAKSQNWVSSTDILEIQKEYSKINDELKGASGIRLPLEVYEEQPLREIIKKEIIIGDRQQKILEILKTRGRAQVWEIKQVFPEVTKRTLRRDFENLLKRGLIERMGERNNTFYRLMVGQA